MIYIRRFFFQIWSLSDPVWRSAINESESGIQSIMWSPDSRHILVLHDFSLFITIWALEVRKCTLLTKITTGQNEVALSYHKVRGLYFLAVIFAETIVFFGIIFKFFLSYENVFSYLSYWSSQHNFRMHFLVHSSSQRILGNLMVTNRSSLVLKFENVANTDFLVTPFFGASDRWNFGYIPFLSLYNHV